LYSSPSIIRIIKLRRMRLAGHVARMGEKRNMYRLLMGKPEGKRPLGKPRRRWVDNIRMDLGEVGWGDVDWILSSFSGVACSVGSNLQSYSPYPERGTSFVYWAQLSSYHHRRRNNPVSGTLCFK
jgi:hypothetical protein